MTMRPLLVDPVLPQNFDCTANEDRSTADLDAWWDQPFAIGREDGTFDVRCLDGGAWDRSTFYGLAKDLPAAEALAKSRLQSWQEMRSEPVVCIAGTMYQVMRPARRPDQEMEILGEYSSPEDAQKSISQLMSSIQR